MVTMTGLTNFQMERSERVEIYIKFSYTQSIGRELLGLWVVLDVLELGQMAGPVVGITW